MYARSSATRLIKKADAQMEATPIYADELALQQTNLSAKLTTHETLNTEIVGLTPGGPTRRGDKEGCKYSEKIGRSLLWIHKVLNPLSPATDTPCDPPPRDATRDPPCGPVHQTQTIGEGR